MGHADPESVRAQVQRTPVAHMWYRIRAGVAVAEVPAKVLEGGAEAVVEVSRRACCQPSESEVWRRVSCPRCCCRVL
mgnify:CR=1 FL=1